MESTQIVVQKESQDLGSHSLKDIQTNLVIKSKTSVTNYKNMVKAAFREDLSRVINSDQTVTDEGLQQIKLASQFAQRKNKLGYYKAVWQANPELEYDLPDQSETKKATKLGQDDQVGQSTWSRDFDPLAEVTAGSELVKRNISTIDRAERIEQTGDIIQAEISDAQSFTSDFVRQLLLNTSNVSVSIGKALAANTIRDIERAKQESLSDYLQSQGVAVAPKPPSGEQSQSS
jgi:hypothetical protein